MEALYTCYWYVWESGYGYTVDQMIGYGYDCTCVDEPVVGCMDPSACNFDPTASLDSGCDYVSCACEDAIVQYTAGSYSGENSFTITDCDGNVLAQMVLQIVEHCV